MIILYEENIGIPPYPFFTKAIGLSRKRRCLTRVFCAYRLNLAPDNHAGIYLTVIFNDYMSKEKKGKQQHPQIDTESTRTLSRLTSRAERREDLLREWEAAHLRPPPYRSHTPSW
jgi:hypothetical protein